MPRRDPLGVIFRPSESGSWDKDGPQFICCVDGHQPKIHEVWTFREDGVTPKVHPTVRVDVVVFIGDCFDTDCLTPTWHRILMFGSKSMNGSVECIVVPNFLSNDGPTWTLNLLDPCAGWGKRGSSTSLNLSSGSGGYSDSVSINCNRPSCVLPIYYRRIFENSHSAACRARDKLLMENFTYYMQSPYTCGNPIYSCLVKRRDDALDDCWDLYLCQ